MKNTAIQVSLQFIYQFVATAFLIVGYTSAMSQTFQNVASDLGIEVYSQAPDYGNGVSFVDYNRDGWDDLTFCRNGQSILRYQNMNGLFIIDDSIPNTLDAKHVSYVDLLNDGNYQVLVTGHFGSVKLYQKIEENWVDITPESNLTTPNTERTYGAAWADFDKDGDLDCYICNYSSGIGAPNWFFENNGDLTFTEKAVELGIDNGLKQSFQATWIDFDHDNWPDLYIINDKLSPNALFRNMGDGTFQDVSSTFNADVVLDAMSNTVGDFDHDGDLDIYMTDDGEGNFLLRNDGSSFSNVAPQLNVDLGGFNWGAQWLDVNNDANLDLYISSINPIAQSLNYMFVQDDEGHFIASPEQFIDLDQMPAYSNAIGDFDNNGFVDIIVPSENENVAALWQNLANDNNYLKVKLEGVISNKDGIGAWINCYFNGQQEVQYVLSGESYLAQNSFNKIFGLHSTNLVDSLTVEWPSGHLDSFFNLPTNQSLMITEGSSLQLNWPQDTVYLCQGDSLYFEFDGFDSYNWSHGPTSPGAYISEPGIYTITAQTNLGIEISSDSLVVLGAPEIELNLETINPSCYGLADGEIIIPDQDILGITATWLSGNDTIPPTGLPAGEYIGYITDSLGCTSQFLIALTNPDSLIITPSLQDVICFGDSTGSIELTVTGGVPPYNIQIPNDGMNLPAGTYAWSVQDANLCSDTDTFTINENPPISVSIDINVAIPSNDSATVSITPSGGVPPYQINWDNGQNQFQLVLSAGFHSFTVLDSLGCILNGTVDVPVSISNILSNKFQVFPNPAKDMLNIQHANNTSFLFTLTDLAGRCVIQETISPIERIYSIDIQFLNSGLYIANIVNLDHSMSYSQRIFIQNQP